MKPLCAILIALTAFAQRPDLPFTADANFLKMPAHIYMGEAAGVATNSKGHVFVYTRTGGAQGTIGGSRLFTHGGSRLFEFDATGKYVREIGQGVYAFLFAQAVKIDPLDNIWIVDQGSTMIVKFDPAGRVLMTLGRKAESINVAPPPAGGRGRGAVPGDNFNRPTDVAWDSAGNIYVTDGIVNARVVKLNPMGHYLKAWGTKGADPGQFDNPSSIAIDSADNIYVADRGNKRIQIFDTAGTFKSQIANVGSPRAICISPGAHPYLYSSDSNPPETMDNGEIYQLEPDGRVVGKFGRAGKLPKEFGTVNQLDCRVPNTLFAGELTNWRVQKLTLR